MLASCQKHQGSKTALGIKISWMVPALWIIIKSAENLILYKLSYKTINTFNISLQLTKLRYTLYIFANSQQLFSSLTNLWDYLQLGILQTVNEQRPLKDEHVKNMYKGSVCVGFLLLIKEQSVSFMLYCELVNVINITVI